MTQYLSTHLTGAYELKLTYRGETYTSWCVDGRMDQAGENLVSLVKEIWSLPDTKAVDNELYDLLDWEFVERNKLPGSVYRDLVEEESCLVEEIDDDY